jgi:hypothetical protein
MPVSITALANLTLATTPTTVTFSSIVGTYRDLFLVVKGTGSTSTSCTIQVNGDTALASYGVVWMRGSGSAASTGAWNTGGASAHWQGFIGSAQSQMAMHFLDYSATDKHKMYINHEADATVLGTRMDFGRWANTAAITQISLKTDSGTWSVGTTFALYGVSA